MRKTREKRTRGRREREREQEFSNRLEKSSTLTNF